MLINRQLLKLSFLAFAFCITTISFAQTKPEIQAAPNSDQSDLEPRLDIQKKEAQPTVAPDGTQQFEAPKQEPEAIPVPEPGPVTVPANPKEGEPFLQVVEPR